MRRPLLVSLSFFLSIFLISCGGENDYSTGELTRPVCTGFALRDDAGQFIGSIGVPNNKVTTSRNNEYVLMAFPIPSMQFIRMVFEKTGTKKAWITGADVANDIAEEPVLNGTSALNAGGTPLLYGSTSGDELSFDLSTLPEGAYRLYVRYNEELYWENIIVTNDPDFLF